MKDKINIFKLGKISSVIVPILLFVFVISFNYSKPFGFFRESNPAMVCINAILWSSNPLLEKLHVPISSYSFDSTAQPSTQFYNTIVSFGSGWFRLPFFFFKICSLSPNEHSIRIFSLIWLTITLLTAYLLAKQITNAQINNTVIIYFTLIFYVFNAATLWYHVQGYLHEIAVLPFYFTGWWLFSKYLKTPTFKILLEIVFVLFTAIQFDWLPFFQAMVMSAYLLFSKSKTKKWAFLLPAIAVTAGMFYIFYHYVQWAGLSAYVNHLQEKFLKRTIGGGKLQLIHGLNYNFNIAIFYSTGFGLLAVTFLICVYKKILRYPIIWMMIAAAMLHHIVFWGFSIEHDHGVVKMAFPLAFAGACFIAEFRPFKRFILASLIVVSNIGLYFFLHNFYTRPGMYSNPDFCYQVGTYIHNQIPSNKEIVFINTEGKYYQQIEFYAQKQYVLAGSASEAKLILNTNYPKASGYFLVISNGKIDKQILSNQ